MKRGWLGLIELFVVLLFVGGWGILELVTLRMDRRRAAREEGVSTAAPASEASARHPER